MGGVYGIAIGWYDPIDSGLPPDISGSVQTLTLVNCAGSQPPSQRRCKTHDNTRLGSHATPTHDGSHKTTKTPTDRRGRRRSKPESDGERVPPCVLTSWLLGEGEEMGDAERSSRSSTDSERSEVDSESELGES